MSRITLRKPEELVKEPVKGPEQNGEQKKPEEQPDSEAAEPVKEPRCQQPGTYTTCPDGGIHVYQDTADGRSCNMLNVPCLYIDTCPAIEAMREAKEREEARRTNAAAAYVASLDKVLQEAIARYLVKHPGNLADALESTIEKLIKEK